MKPRQRGKQWEISYRCPGYSKPIFERFQSYEAAKLRIAEIEYEKSIGQLRPPKVSSGKANQPSKRFVTVGELMDEYVQLYGLNHWGDSYLSYSRHRIEHYIKPYLGNVLVSDLTTHELDLYYNSLQDKPAVVLKGHKADNKTVSLPVIEKVHALLRSAFKQAVAWGYISTNPAINVTLPKCKSKPREVWTAEQAQEALALCTDSTLRLAMLLALGCSLRIGEILGLTWDCVNIEEANVQQGNAFVRIEKELKRCQKQSLSDLQHRGRSDIILTFPELKQTGSTTSLVLKAPKTDSSIRTVYLPLTVANALRAIKAQQDELQRELGGAYTNFNLVLAHEDGRPYEERQVAEKLRNFIREHNLPPVVFHSLRHCSTSLKLELSGGNIKAVQGDTGHAQARMVTDLYAHTNHEARRQLAQKVEQDFFRQVSPSTPILDSDLDNAIHLMKNNPELAKLLMSMVGKLASV